MLLPIDDPPSYLCIGIEIPAAAVGGGRRTTAGRTTNTVIVVVDIIVAVAVVVVVIVVGVGVIVERICHGNQRIEDLGRIGLRAETAGAVDAQQRRRRYI